MAKTPATKNDYNAIVRTTTVTQPANEMMGTEEKKLCYLLLTTETGQVTINVGEKTIDKVNEITNQKKGGK